jgi:motility quorum-sensing regulator/GCU-specific mRNA interferase toxin
MEKRVPHYRLQEILAIVSARGLGVFTATAAFNAAAMGLSEAQVIAVVMSVTRAMFYKSMTTNNDSRKWHNQPLAAVFWRLSGMASSSIKTCITSLARIAKLPTSNSRCKMVWW